MRTGSLTMLVLAVLALAASVAPASAAPACFGAASRDPESPCSNPKLNFQAVPSPEAALLEPSAPCAPLRPAQPEVCTFGVAGAKTGVALMGDSHSTHWRAALAVVAADRRWRGFSINRNNCPFTLARSTGRCTGWTSSVIVTSRSIPRSAPWSSRPIPARG